MNKVLKEKVNKIINKMIIACCPENPPSFELLTQANMRGAARGYYYTETKSMKFRQAEIDPDTVCHEIAHHLQYLEMGDTECRMGKNFKLASQHWKIQKNLIEKMKEMGLWREFWSLLE